MKQNLLSSLIRRSLSTEKKRIFRFPIYFPGQGVQYVGMGGSTESKSGANLFNIASEVIGEDLYKICKSGPAEVLNSTKFAQVSIFVSSMAGLSGIDLSATEPTIAFGNSLGEYTALCFAKVLSFEDAVRLTFARGVAMDRCCRTRPGAMATISGIRTSYIYDQCESISTEDKIVCVANYLSSSACVVSGDTQAVQELLTKMQQIHQDSIKCTLLNVAGAFHSSLMAPAEYELNSVLNNTQFNTPSIPVMMGVDAEVHYTAQSLRSRLLQQLTSPLLIDSCISKIMTAGEVPEKHVVVGPDTTFPVLIKKINKRAVIQIINVI